MTRPRDLRTTKPNHKVNSTKSWIFFRGSFSNRHCIKGGFDDRLVQLYFTALYSPLTSLRMVSMLSDIILLAESVTTALQYLVFPKPTSSRPISGRPSFATKLDGWVRPEYIQALTFRSFTRIGKVTTRFLLFSSTRSLWGSASCMLFIYLLGIDSLSSDLCCPYSWASIWKAFHERRIISSPIRDNGSAS